MLLSTDGSRITNRDGRPVALRGFGLGGWMNMENFITGYPANEEAQREAVRGFSVTIYTSSSSTASSSTSSPRMTRGLSGRSA